MIFVVIGIVIVWYLGFQTKFQIYIINLHPEFVCLSPLVSPEPLDLWSKKIACVMYSTNGRFLRKKVLENRKKKKIFFEKIFTNFFFFFFFKIFLVADFFFFNSIFFEIFFRFSFLLFCAGRGRAQRAAGGCRRAKRAVRRRPRTAAEGGDRASVP